MYSNFVCGLFFRKFSHQKYIISKVQEVTEEKKPFGKYLRILICKINKEKKRKTVELLSKKLCFAKNKNIAIYNM